MAQYFSLLQKFQTGSVAHPNCYSVGIGSLSPGVKWPLPEAGLLPPSSVKVKNKWSCNSSPLYTFMSCRGKVSLSPFQVSKAVNREMGSSSFCTTWIPFFHGATGPTGSGPPHYRVFTITLRHATLCRTPLDEWSARHTDLYLTTHNTHKTQISVLPAGFEPTVPAN